MRTLCGTPHAAESAAIAPNPSHIPARNEKKKVWSTGLLARSLAAAMSAASIAGVACIPTGGLIGVVGVGTGDRGGDEDGDGDKDGDGSGGGGRGNIYATLAIEFVTVAER